MARVLLVTIGSLGDLHPFIAIGRALAEAGHRPLLAIPADGVAKARAAGLEAVAILPGYATICDRLGMGPDQLAARVLEDPNFVVDQILIPSLGESTAALDALAGEADLIAGSIFALAAGIVAERRGLPLVEILLQPMTLFSAWAAPRAPRFGWLAPSPRGPLGRQWNRTGYALIRAALRSRHGRAIDRVRAAQGLAPARGAPLIDSAAATAGKLGCWSPAFAPLPPDAGATTRLTGFPFFDSEHGDDAPLAPELARFLDAGPPPIVFTLGSFAVAAAGRFYAEAAEAAVQLGRRATLLTGEGGPPRIEGDRLWVGYAPHSQLFARAAAIVHHGGIGTTGQALRAGKPQLVVPHFGDQYDNAARLEALGVARTLHRRRVTAATLAASLDRLLIEPGFAAAARRIAAEMSGEDGAGNAARAILALLR